MATTTTTDATISRAVLITGCSSGIGEATALRLAGAGFTVYATARNAGSLAHLAEAGCKTLALDVTSEASMKAAIATIEAEAGTIGILINNAGYSQSGAVEEVTIDAARRQFETNVFGLMRLVQLVLPGMRRQGWGKIVNMSSMGGKFTLPGGGVYHASKHALESLSDALRFEVRGFGVDVIIIEPGLIRTQFSNAAVKAMDATRPAGEVYAELNEAVARATREAYEKGMFARLAGEADDVARVVERAITKKRPRARYRVTASARLLMTQRAMMPDGMWDAFLRSQFPAPGPASRLAAMPGSDDSASRPQPALGK